MEDTEQPSAAKAGSSRTTQACQRCRNLKTRCLPSVQPGLCQRCFSAGKECAWAEAPRRTRKLRAPSRIAQVEQKIDGLVAKLVHVVDNEVTTDSASASRPIPEETRAETWRNQGALNVVPGSWMPTPSFEPNTVQPDRNIQDASESAEVDRQYLEDIRSIHRYSDREHVPHAPEGMFRPSKLSEAPIEHDVVTQLLISGEADTLVGEYRTMSANFPFVMLSPQTTAKQLHEHRPMLLLAVLLVASCKDHSRQRTLDGIFRMELANRTIVQPRRTLGLVQSVLVYLSWYHFVFSHKTQQIFFLHNLVIGLALDMGLHQDFQPLSFPTMPQRPKGPPPSAEELRERHRAFLGCYYLSSMVAAGLQKPNLLKHSPIMTEWAKGLKRDREYETDETISLLLSLRQIDDQVQDELFTADASQLPMSDGRALMHVRFIDIQLDSWKRECNGVASQRLLELSFSYAKMQLHSVALRPSPSELPASVRLSQLNSLLSALEASKRFLDTLLSFPAHEYHLISFSEWMRLPPVIMTVSRLCIPSKDHAAIGWDTQAAQDRVRLDLCLESLCYRMQTLSTFDQTKRPHPDFWYAMRMINELTKNWYIRKIRPEQPSQTPSVATPSTSNEQRVSEGSCPITGASMRSTHHTGDRHNTLAGTNYNYMEDFNMDMPPEADVSSDPFTLMRSAEFDMSQFFDMAGGIWGDDSYNNYAGMAFGSGAPF